ncbi:MAG: multidrug effflux MFS transporter [Rhodobacteraceae bacterium]|nr:multidrug effflux MFS transporter [Paracoccaceae bacterium]
MGKRLPLPEFVAMIALLFSLIAFGTDAMLPAFPQIATDLELEDVNNAQLVLTIFILGTGLGQLFFGPLSDAIGRKPSIAFGTVLFIVGCVVCYFVESFLWMLIGRFVQGLGVAAPRTVTLALVRDLYKGRAMAQVMSFSFGVFIIVPALAPSIGQVIMGAYGWRSIYLSFIVFALVTLVWVSVRQEETHPVAARRVPDGSELFGSLKLVLGNPVVVVYMSIQTLLLGGLFAYLSSVQQIFADSFGVSEKFPLFFAGIALASGAAAFINGALVMRLGMRRMCKIAFGLAVIAAALSILFQTWGAPEFRLIAFSLWSISALLFMSLSLGNINALAMEPMGDFAGLASAVIGAVATIFAVVIAIPIGLAFNGTPMPLIVSHLVLYLIAFGLMQLGLRGRMVEAN